eukprot:CAMPEP_0119465386 /NCGR_PEP_ID=MMETSP1344-20130328/538_1 /TAXON_ID=236787 /ORGANISM="Florenciella parvula, Strain CCMP2471" /LENGTH=142 /DNA_ID=CAMNT_0007497641 /DNA_START=54 /DNA_END=481 /DNA_ORIENTATION=-
MNSLNPVSLDLPDFLWKRGKERDLRLHEQRTPRHFARLLERNDDAAAIDRPSAPINVALPAESAIESGALLLVERQTEGSCVEHRLDARLARAVWERHLVTRMSMGKWMFVQVFIVAMGAAGEMTYRDLDFLHRLRPRVALL